SLRNCSLQGSIPDFSRIPALGYLDLSYNNLTGEIPRARLSTNITTIDLSHNKLNGSIPESFGVLPQLQRLSLDNNQLSGDVPVGIRLNMSFGSNETLLLDFRNNSLSNITTTIRTIPNITIRLGGNPVCSQNNQRLIAEWCGTQNETEDTSGRTNNSVSTCPQNACPPPYYEYIQDTDCFCVAPFEVGYRLKSPGFYRFPSYLESFEEYLTVGLNLSLYQLSIDRYIWEPGPRLAMNLKFFPLKNPNVREFNDSEIQRLRQKFAEWKIPDSDIFGPYEWINITLTGPYAKLNLEPGGGSGLSKGALAGVLIGVIFGTTVVSSIAIIMVLKRRTKNKNTASRRKLLARQRIKIAGVKDFDFSEMALATNNFSASMQVGQGGYGKVYKGILADGMIVAIKRAQEGSLQGGKEFSTEIELLSRVHHRNLVSLVGYCNDEGEQMLVYEYMSNGTIREHLSASSKKPINFAQRLRIALGAARGILYLHNEANPPIFHRDIKASNILLDDRFNARVADFGLSRLAPAPDLEGSAPGHVSTVVKGTPGYLDPEYFLTHKLTDKSDVYSFGVVLLELLTGMQPISHGKNIVREVNMAYESGMMLSMIDSNMGSYPSECLEPFANLALSCCKDETDARPSMAEVVHKLEKILEFTPGADTTPSQSIEMEALAERKSMTVEMASQNPYVSSNILGSDLRSGTIPDIAPR
ncbi:hypothetical protein KI387_026404, partial [Taxus chinensis]